MIKVFLLLLIHQNKLNFKPIFIIFYENFQINKEAMEDNNPKKLDSIIDRLLKADP